MICVKVPFLLKIILERLPDTFSLYFMMMFLTFDLEMARMDEIYIIEVCIPLQEIVNHH